MIDVFVMVVASRPPAGSAASQEVGTGRTDTMATIRSTGPGREPVASPVTMDGRWPSSASRSPAALTR